MLASFILPFNITFASLLLLVITAVIVKRSYKKTIKRFPLYCTIVFFVGFVPSCIAVKMAIDPFRYGIFHYKNYVETDGFRGQGYLPNKAKNITLEKMEGRFRAKYKITSDDLESWLEQYRKEHKGEHYTAPTTLKEVATQEDFSLYFNQMQGDMPEGAIKYNMPHSRNGAGFEIWYSKSLEIGFEHASYW